MKKILFLTYVLLTTAAGIFIGTAGAFGACVPIWGSHILDTALGSPADRTHPAFWLAMILFIPSMLVGMAGTIALLILPVAFRFPSAAATNRSRDLYFVRFLRWYGERLVSYSNGEESRLNNKKPNDTNA